MGMSWNCIALCTAVSDVLALWLVLWFADHQVSVSIPTPNIAL